MSAGCLPGSVRPSAELLLAVSEHDPDIRAITGSPAKGPLSRSRPSSPCPSDNLVTVRFVSPAARINHRAICTFAIARLTLLHLPSDEPICPPQPAQTTALPR